jgi:hypothetical protein
MVSVNASRQKRGADININMRISPQLRQPLEKAYRHKVKTEHKNPKSYGFSTFVRELATEGLKLYCNDNEV